MTMHAEELLGAQVTGADGKVIGTIEQVFEDDANKVPAWASVRSGKASRFVPLGDSQASGDSLNVPFDAQTIMAGPKLEVGEHMSADQVDELDRYYGTMVPAQTGQRDRGGEKPDAGAGEKPEQREKAEQRHGAGEKADDWLVRREQRLKVDKETRESAHVKLHRYVDVEQTEQKVPLFHEEYVVERVPVDSDKPIADELAEAEQEIVLHEERGIPSKETVPVERLRLVSKRVEGDETFRDEIQRERIEVEPEEASSFTGGRNKSRG